jgi:hypothetical protein
MTKASFSHSYDGLKTIPAPAQISFLLCASVYSLMDWCENSPTSLGLAKTDAEEGEEERKEGRKGGREKGREGRPK